MSHHHDHEDHHHHDHDSHHHSHDHHHHHEPEAMSFEEKTRKILAHWQKHNSDHAKTYGDWAGKAREHGMDEVAALIGEVEEMTLAINVKLEAALKKMG